jgi:hypothetical protein
MHETAQVDTESESDFADCPKASLERLFEAGKQPSWAIMLAEESYS